MQYLKFNMYINQVFIKGWNASQLKDRLMYNGIIKVKDLVKKTEEDLLKIPGVSEKSVETLKKLLEDNFLHLGMNDDDINKMEMEGFMIEGRNGVFY